VQLAPDRPFGSAGLGFQNGWTARPDHSVRDHDHLLGCMWMENFQKIAIWLVTETIQVLVCGMIVDRNNAASRSEYEAQTCNFCSHGC
jgi:hypothetical protein